MGGRFGVSKAPPGAGVDEGVQPCSEGLEERQGPGRERFRHVPLLVAEHVLQ